MRMVIALFLTLILGFASQVEAVARSEMAGATQAAACGATMVMLDATGKPLPADHCASHCLAAGLVALDLAAPAPARPETSGRRVAPAPGVMTRDADTPPAIARGPPSAL